MVEDTYSDGHREELGLGCGDCGGLTGRAVITTGGSAERDCINFT